MCTENEYKKAEMKRFNALMKMQREVDSYQKAKDKPVDKSKKQETLNIRGLI